jgi:hypothetical protein
MPTTSKKGTVVRERWGDELEFEDVLIHREGDELTGGVALPAREHMMPVFPAKDYESIAKELGTDRVNVSYAIHEELVFANSRSTKPRSKFTLTGSWGEGDNYNPELDPKVAPQLQAARIAALMAGQFAAASNAKAK